MRRAATVYRVSEATLRRRRARKKSTRNIYPRLSNLIKIEGEALIHYIKKLDTQEFTLTLYYVEDIAK